MSVKFAKTETSSEGIGAMDRARAAVDDGSLWSAEDVFVFTDAMLTWEGDKVYTHLIQNTRTKHVGKA